MKRKFYASVDPANGHVGRISVRPTLSDLEAISIERGIVLSIRWADGDLRVLLPFRTIVVPAIIASTEKFCPCVGDHVSVLFRVAPPTTRR